MTIQDAVEAARARFVAAGIEQTEAALDAELLERHILSWDRATYVARRTEPPDTNFLAQFEVLTLRRERREPAAQILGRREFWGLDFFVTRDVLTPRPETELIVEAALSIFAPAPPPMIVDVATGSGCLAVALAREWPHTCVVATDVSLDALLVAATNVARHEVAGRVRLVQARYATAVRRGIDLMVSNPPYIPLTDASSLPPEVATYEPAVALFGGADGLDAYRNLLPSAEELLTPGGYLIVEFGFGQARALAELARMRAHLDLVEMRPDLQGIPRVLIMRRRERYT